MISVFESMDLDTYTWRPSIKQRLPKFIPTSVLGDMSLRDHSEAL